MPLVSREKTNWKFLIVVFILAGIAAWGVLYYTKSVNKELFSLSQLPQIQIPEKQPDVTANWETYIDIQNGFEFKYPKNFGTDVWRPQFWPPTSTVVSLSADPVETACPNLHSATGAPIVPQNGKTQTGIYYLLYQGSDVGAGQLYLQYCYVFGKNQHYIVVDFVIHAHTGCINGGCGAYCGTQYEQECRNQDTARDIEQPIQKMISTFKFLL